MGHRENMEYRAVELAMLRLRMAVAAARMGLLIGRTKRPPPTLRASPS